MTFDSTQETLKRIEGANCGCVDSISSTLEEATTAGLHPSSMASESQCIDEGSGGGVGGGGGGRGGGEGGRKLFFDCEVSGKEDSSLTNEESEFDKRFSARFAVFAKRLQDQSEQKFELMSKTILEQDERLRKFEEEKNDKQTNQTVKVLEKAQNLNFSAEQEKMFRVCAELRSTVITFEVLPGGTRQCPLFEHLEHFSYVEGCGNDRNYVRLGQLVKHVAAKHDGIWGSLGPKSIQFGYRPDYVEKAMGIDRSTLDAFLAIEHFQTTNEQQIEEIDKQPIEETNNQRIEGANKPTKRMPQVPEAEQNLISPAQCIDMMATFSKRLVPVGGEKEAEVVENEDEVVPFKVEVCLLEIPKEKEVSQDEILLEGDDEPEMTAEEWKEKYYNSRKMVINLERGGERRGKKNVIKLKKEGFRFKREHLPKTKETIDKDKQTPRGVQRVEKIDLISTDPLLVHLRDHAPGLIFSRATVTNGDCW